jgi:dTDP-4-dehydrorhamnose reductase
MRIFCTGANGRIGKRLVGLGLLPLHSDVTDYQALSLEIKHIKPDIVVHLAAITGVDYCERKENQEEVIKVNYRGTVNVATVTKENQCGMVFLSTDHIYNGKRGPYKESYPYWMPNLLGQKEKPVNFYGLIKLTAELAIETYPHAKIVRTSYLFDWDRMKDDTSIYYPTFMYRSFMHIDHFAKAFHDYLMRFYEMPTHLNISGVDTVSWYAFAKAFWSGRKILPRKHDMKKEFAPRPYKTGLDVSLSKSLGLPQFSYRDGLLII